MTGKTIALHTGRSKTFAHRLRSLLTWATEAHERNRQRHALARLNDTQLADIGLTRRDVSTETAKPFWRG